MDAFDYTCTTRPTLSLCVLVKASVTFRIGLSDSRDSTRESTPALRHAKDDSHYGNEDTKPAAGATAADNRPNNPVAAFGDSKNVTVDDDVFSDGEAMAPLS